MITVYGFIVAAIILCVSRAATSATYTYKTDNNILEDANLDTFTLIKKYGYPCEIHRVYTEDGYILEMHRIPHGVNNTHRTKRPVVFLQHGLLSSSAEWVLMMPGKGFAYILAESGYDVWMGNARGNSYSRHHVSMSPERSKFWQFSWHEIGYYDVPAMIDYALRTTGMSRLHYVGFSQGTTAFWVMTSTRPEYNDKIVSMQALAPVAHISNARSPLIKAVAPFTNSLERITKLIGPNEFLPNGLINYYAGQVLCLEEALTQILCTNLLFLICGYDEEQLNTTMLPIVMGHTPAGASTKQFIHYGQVHQSGVFRQFDHGWLSNRIKYGTFKPPEYVLKDVRTPVFLHYADNDWLSVPKDVDILFKKLPNAVKHRISLPKFNHLDFVFAIDARKLVYDRVINIMKKMNSIET